jgi:WD40 repeat protein/tRNA A-37 threonylcarbamoyl transferase component Bud32
VPEVEDLSGRKLGEFVLRAQIGEGGFGAVYRCEQPLLGREAVVKVLHPRLRHNNVVLQRFLREAQLASQLDHPCAAHIYAFGIERDDGLFWIAMEMVQGVGLNRWLQEHGRMALDRFVPFFEQLAEVVHAAHERGIVHRDLKPSNVMVIERAGRLVPKLLDFGVAKLLDGAPAMRAAPAPGATSAAETAAQAAGSGSLLGPVETVTQTASAPGTSDRDLRRLTHVASMVGSPPYMSPEQWINPAEVGPSSDLYALGVVAYEAITGRRPFSAASNSEYADLHCDAPVPSVGEGLAPALDRFFERALAKRPEERWRTALELAGALRAEWVAARIACGGSAAGAAAHGDDEAAPYLGLASYAVGDAGRFVGREAEVAAFLGRLRISPLHVVVGPPGTGKSSFVHAGVLPGLPPGWRTVTLRPGAAPLAALAFRLETAGVPGDDLRTLLATSPSEAAARVTDTAGSEMIVVVIDQLEELFTLGAGADERSQFAAAVAQLASSADLPVRVIATIRDDFLMRLDSLPALRRLLSSALVLLGNPLHGDLVRVVVEPARRAGYMLSDPELAHDMVKAVASRPGALALLSFTALRLWELRDRTLRQLTRSAYEAMEGVAGALVRHAEATFEALSADEQHLVREIFRQLVTADGARAPLSAEELHQRLAAPHSAAALDKLIAARLIATSGAEQDRAGTRQIQVEVIHDALLEAWPRLRGWIREDIDGVRMREQLWVAARHWGDRGRPRGLLWREDALRDLQRWLRKSKSTHLSELETAFVDASRRLARLGRVRLGLVAISFAIAVAVFGYNMMRTRIDQSVMEHQLTQSYADWGEEALLNGKPVEALIYLDKAARRGDNSARVKFMLSRAAEPFLHEVARLHAEHGRMWWASYSRNGHRIVTADDNGAQVWNARSMTVERSLPHGDIVYQAEFTPDGTRVVTAGNDGVVKVWDTGSGQLVWPLHRRSADDTKLFWALAISPRGTTVAAIDLAATVVDVWDLRTGVLIQELTHDPWPKRLPSLAFSRDGEWLAASTGGDVYVYNITTWNRLLIAGADVSALSFDPAGDRLAIATLRGEVSIWKVPTGEREWRLRESGDQIRHAAFSPDGTLLVATGQNGIDRVWDTHTGELRVELKNHRSASVWAEFDASSHLVASVDQQNEVAISDMTQRATVSTLDGLTRGSTIPAVHFDPLGRRVMAASWDGTARVWDTAPQYLRWATQPLGPDCSNLLRDEPDRRFLAITCGTRDTTVWDTDDPTGPKLVAKLPARTPAPADFLSSAPAVSVDGDRAAIATGNTVTLYELPSSRILTTVQHDAQVTTVAFDARGRDLVTGSTDGIVLVTREGRASLKVATLSAAVDVAAFLPDGRLVVADAHLRFAIYRVEPQAIPIFEQGLAARVTVLRASADGRRLLAIPTFASAASAASLVLWDLEDPRQRWYLDSYNAPVLSARFFDGNREILTASSDGFARLWDARTGRLRASYPERSAYVDDAVFDPDGTMAVIAGGDGMLRFWDVSSGHMIWTLQAHQSAVIGIHFDGTSLVTRARTGEVARWDLFRLPSSRTLSSTVRDIVRCLPLRFDDETAGLVDQDPHCGT